MTPPTLAPPGAGLPWVELQVAHRILFPLACRRFDWPSATHAFLDEGAKLLAVWDSLPAGQVGKRVLIPRPRGLEDSSRNWSVSMTVEHLNIVGTGIRDLIDGLRAGRLPDRPARTEDVKPTGELPPATVRAAFERLLADAAKPGEPVPRDTGLRAPHPWFGPLDAFRWHCLLAVHQQLHRKQAETIRDRFAAE